MNFIPKYLFGIFSSRVLAVFFFWIICIFIAAANLCFLYLTPSIPQVGFSIAIIFLPIMLLGVMISNIYNKRIDLWVLFGIIFESLLLLYLWSQMI